MRVTILSQPQFPPTLRGGDYLGCVNQGAGMLVRSQNSASHTIEAPKRVNYKYMETQRAQIILWLCHAGTKFLLPLLCILYDLILIRMLEEEGWKHEAGRIHGHSALWTPTHRCRLCVCDVVAEGIGGQFITFNYLVVTVTKVLVIA